MVTIRAHQVKRHIEEIDIERVLLILLQEHGVHVDRYAYELDPKYKQLHLHGLCNTGFGFQYRGITSISGFRVYWKKILPGSEKTCMGYICKNADQCHSVINDFQSYALND